MPRVRGSVPVTLAHKNEKADVYTPAYSCPNKEDRSSSGWQDKNKVQDQVLALSVHAVTR
jgi:hypothetical protein